MINAPHSYMTHSDADIQMANPMNPHIKPKSGNTPAKGLHGPAGMKSGPLLAKLHALAKMRSNANTQTL